MALQTFNLAGNAREMNPWEGLGDAVANFYNSASMARQSRYEPKKLEQEQALRDANIAYTSKMTELLPQQIELKAQLLGAQIGKAAKGAKGMGSGLRDALRNRAAGGRQASLQQDSGISLADVGEMPAYESPLRNPMQRSIAAAYGETRAPELKRLANTLVPPMEKVAQYMERAQSPYAQQEFIPQEMMAQNGMIPGAARQLTPEDIMQYQSGGMRGAYGYGGGDVARQSLERQEAPQQFAQEQEMQAEAKPMNTIQDYVDSLPEEQFMRALMAAEGGDDEAAIKILTEKPEKGGKEDWIEGVDGQPLGQKFSDMPAGEVSKAKQSMRQELAKAKDASHVTKILIDMAELQEKHPDMGNYFEAAFIGGDTGLLGRAARFMMDKDKRAALEKYNKLAAQLVTYGSSVFGGGTRFTDARQRLVESIKPNASNSSEANMFIIRDMYNTFAPYANYKKNLELGFKKNREVIANPDAYSYTPFEQAVFARKEKNRGRDGELVQGVENALYQGQGSELDGMSREELLKIRNELLKSGRR